MYELSSGLTMPSMVWMNHKVAQMVMAAGAMITASVLFTAGFTDPVPNSEIRPNKKAANAYAKLLEKYAASEIEALDKIAV